MKRRMFFVFILFVSLQTFLFADEGVEKANEIKDTLDIERPYFFDIVKQNYHVGSEFTLLSKDIPPSRVKKSRFRIRTNYDLANSDGWEATGITRFFSFGQFFKWAKQIDIYDTQWNYVGGIYGKMLTTATACYKICDFNDNCIAYSYVDRGGRGVVVQDRNMESNIIFQMTRNYELDVEDMWNVAVFQPKHIDSRIIRIFSSFIVDLQDSFKKDR